eukprot:4512080-Alexandrium_andersonii.AAC.1
MRPCDARGLGSQTLRTCCAAPWTGFETREAVGKTLPGPFGIVLAGIFCETFRPARSVHRRTCNG